MKMYKACQNDNCDNKHKCIKCAITDKFCIKCGTPLYHVCPQCGNVIENDLEKLCQDCQEKIQQKKQQKQDAAKNVVKAAGGVAADAIKVVPGALTIAAALIPSKFPAAKLIKNADKKINGNKK